MRLAVIAILLGTVLAQYFPPAPEGVTKLKSKYHEGVTISYKEPGICETTPGVKSYSGYVHLPPGLLSDISGEAQNYPINTFFWFFESRKDPSNAPLSIWLNGGPGGSSLMGLLQENGPCFIGEDSNSTIPNPHSWNNEVNMLYLDQPNHVGFSYDVLTNGTLVPEDGHITPADFTDGVPDQNNTFRVGTFASQAHNTTANSTTHAAHAVWHFAQTWFAEFPHYKPHDDRVSLWAESYGGHYGPAVFRFFQAQNEKILDGTISEKGTNPIHLDTLGIINGCVDAFTQHMAYADMAYNNTYGIQIYNQTVYDAVVDSFKRPGGCKDRMIECHKLMAELDPNSRGENERVNSKCSSAVDYCESSMLGPYENDANHALVDIAHPKADPFPAPYLIGYLSQHWVQEALGVPVNFSFANQNVGDAFSTTGDFLRPDSLNSIAYLIESGVKVALVYGDRDYVCNWIGGEEVSTAIDYSRAEEFRGAGYTPILSTVGVGGQVRQLGNFSFSRVYQAGHEVPSYQPEVSYEIFMRALRNTDIATGLVPVTDDYITEGPPSTWHIKNAIPEVPKPMCYILNPMTCTEEQFAALRNGSAVVKDFILVEDNEQDGSGFDGGWEGEQYAMVEEL